eukprot:6377348-Alexandrium_andersonii.AAC.1
MSHFGPAQDDPTAAVVPHDKIVDIVLQVPTAQEQRAVHGLAIHVIRLAAERPNTPLADLSDKA